jgi:hypothetical protein
VEPGSGVSIRVRGNTSIRSGNGPLIVVDGVPLDGGNVSGGGDNTGASSARNPLNLSTKYRKYDGIERCFIYSYLWFSWG